MTEEKSLISEYLKINEELKLLKKEKENLKTKMLTEMKMADTNVLQDEIGIAKYTSYDRTAINKEKVETYCANNNIPISTFVSTNECMKLNVEVHKNEEK